MNNGVYEIANIERHSGLTEADTMRLGRRVIPTLMHEGYRAVLIHADNHDKAIMTSTIISVNESEKDVIEFTTRNTTYVLRKVSE